MDVPLPHERPAYLLLPRGAQLGTALRDALAHREVRVAALPPPWFLERAGVDLLAALPGLRTLTPESLPQVLAALATTCTPAALDALVLRTWREGDENLRLHFLQRGALRTMAGIFGLAAKSRDTAPPPTFVDEQVRVHRLELQYRLAPERSDPPPPAPAEEGSLIVYPFDLAGRLARRELGLPQDGGPVIELYAYVWQHARHVAFWRRLASALGAELRGP